MLRRLAIRGARGCPWVVLVLLMLLLHVGAWADIDPETIEKRTLGDPFFGFFDDIPYHNSFMEHDQDYLTNNELHAGIDVRTAGANRTLFSDADTGYVVGYGQIGDSIVIRYRRGSYYWYVQYMHITQINVANIKNEPGAWDNGVVIEPLNPVAWINAHHLHIEVGVSEFADRVLPSGCEWQLNPAVYAYEDAWFCADTANPIIDDVWFDPAEPIPGQSFRIIFAACDPVADGWDTWHRGIYQAQLWCREENTGGGYVVGEFEFNYRNSETALTEFYDGSSNAPWGHNWPDSLRYYFDVDPEFADPYEYMLVVSDAAGRSCESEWDEPGTEILLAGAEVEQMGACASISWECIDEWCVQGFDVMRSYQIDGELEQVNESLIQIDLENGHHPSIYNHLDCNVIVGVEHFYRVRVTRNDGAVILSDAISLVPVSCETEVYCSPNPSPSTVHINLAPLATPGDVRVAVYDVSGRLVREVVETLLPGDHRITWNGRDSSGRSIASGVYFISVETPGVRSDHKVLVLR